MLSSLRQSLRPLGRIVAKPFVMLGVSPNLITLAAIPLSSLSAVFTAQGCFVGGFALAVPALFLDFLDGAVARASGRETPFGNHLEAVVDRYVEGALLVGLSVHFPLLATSALTFSVLVSYIKARVGLVVLSDNRDWPGVGDRADRVTVVLITLLCLAYDKPALAQASLVFLTLVAAIGSVQRILHSKRLIEQAQEEGRLLGS